MNNIIKIKLPFYIENIFQNASIDWENDYLKSIFDDRNINLKEFYELNFQIYKVLLINSKYNDKDFLKIKNNLFYLYEAWIKRVELDFIFSHYYNSNLFIKNELGKAWTKFDKFCRDILLMESKKVLWYLSSNKCREILKIEIRNPNPNSSILSKQFLDKEDLFFLVKKIFSENEIIDLIKNKESFVFDFIKLFLSLNWLKYLSKLSLNKDIFNLINEDINRRRPNLFDSILESPISDKIIKYLDIDNHLIECFQMDNNYKLILTYLFYTQKTLDYLVNLWLENHLKNENHPNFNWLVESIAKTEFWKSYLLKLNTAKINNKLFILNEKFNKWKSSKKDLDQIKKWKIQLDENLSNIINTEEWIKFLKDNFTNNEISNKLLEKSHLIIRMCSTSQGVRYLRGLNLDNQINQQLTEESNNKRIFALLSNLLKTDEWIIYLRHLNKYNSLKGILLKEMLYFNKEQFSNLAQFKGLYIKENIINVLQWRHEIVEWTELLIHNLIATQEWISYIIESNIKDKFKNFLLETQTNIFHNNLDIFTHTSDWVQYLKDILNLETDDIKNQVYDFIKTSKSGSCLLSWYRWTWKTSLLNSVVRALQNVNEEEIIKVIINIPEQKKDENWNKKSFNKNELITRIIREIYHSLVKHWYSKKEILNFEEQYIRTFKQVEDIEWFFQFKKRWFFQLAISILSFSLPIWIWLLVDYILWVFSIKILWLSFWLWLDFIKLFSAFVLIVLNFLVFRMIANIAYKTRIERALYNDDIAEYRLSSNIFSFNRKDWLFSVFKKFICINFYKNIYKSIINWFINIFIPKHRKFVIIIDELDKLLDLDKWLWKWNIDMKDIFDLLWKLKTLFFDNTWAIFFVVTNKDAYNYFLENKHSEDDLVSNIFNKVLYLPMVRRENFNLNRTFNIDWNDDNTKFGSITHSYLNKWLYYKSHWNWRKANFMLNQELKFKEIFLKRDNIEYEMKFYDFIDILYDLFLQEDKIINPGESFYEFIDKFILSWVHLEWQVYNDNYQGIIQKLKIGISLNKATDSQWEIISKINELSQKYTNSKSFDTFGYMNSSIEKISNQPAYRDFILNNILNIIEILKHDKTLRIEDIFLKLKFCEIDIKYPAFEDLTLIYIPFTIYYLNNLNT